MQTFKEIVNSAGKLLLAHPVGQQAHISSLWNVIKFRGMEQKQTENDASLSPTDESIALYPAIRQKAPAQADSIVLREFGKLLLRKAGTHGNSRWSQKLVLPSVKQIAAVQEKLSSPDFRSGNQTYRELVESFPRAVDRLVALNLTNALLANGMPFSSSRGVQLEQWGPTMEYATLKKYYSLIPLTSAYAPREVHADFGIAFSEMIINKMRSIRESSTAISLQALIREICETAR